MKKVVSILFSDMKGYSQITDDHLKEVVNKEFSSIQQKILTENNHFYKNTWGDALLVCSYDYFDLANIALNLRDEFKKTNWMRLGLPELAIRVGVHTQRTTLIEENNKVIDIVGSGVDTTARIEPIVEPNKVYASNLFCEHLKDEEHLNIQIIPLGKKQLAKNYKEMELFELKWDYEEQSVIKNHITENNFDIPIPKIKREFSDIEQNDFLASSFSEILNYFQKASNALEKQYPTIKIKIEKISVSKFICKLYVDSNEKHKCKIWFSTDGHSFGFSNQISYAENFYDSNDSSMNDWLSISNDGYEIYFSQSNMHFGNLDSELISKEKWTCHDGAKYLWLRFTEQLEHIRLV